jgi:hypothetical protein
MRYIGKARTFKQMLISADFLRFVGHWILYLELDQEWLELP